jgi:hypothetical protein
MPQQTVIAPRIASGFRHEAAGVVEEQLEAVGVTGGKLRGEIRRSVTDRFVGANLVDEPGAFCVAACDASPALSSTEPIIFTDGAACERIMAPWSRSARALFLDWRPRLRKPSPSRRQFA